MASLAESGQQTPIMVVRSSDHSERYLVIDGYKRVAALEQLGGDTVEATVWTMSEAKLCCWTARCASAPQESALEQGWLLSELEQRFGYSLEELGRRFDRSVNWVSPRWALVELFIALKSRTERVAQKRNRVGLGLLLWPILALNPGRSSVETLSWLLVQQSRI